MLRKKTKTSARQQVTMRRSLPVDRYYSSSSPARRSLGDNAPRREFGERRQSDIARKPAYSFSQIVSLAAHWAGALGIVLVVLLNLIMNSTGVKIVPTGSENIYRDDQVYTSEVNRAFSESVFNRSKVTFDSKRFEGLLRQKMPEIEAATAVVPLVGLKLQVGLRISPPLVRAQIGPASQGVIAENGALAFSDTTSGVSSKYSDLPLLRFEPMISAPDPGTLLITSEESQLIALLKNELDGSESARPKIESLTYAVSKREITIKCKGVQFSMRFTTADREVRSQVGTAIATLKQLQEQGKLPSEYIDVRVSGRVFVK